MSNKFRGSIRASRLARNQIKRIRKDRSQMGRMLTVSSMKKRQFVWKRWGAFHFQDDYQCLSKRQRDRYSVVKQEALKHIEYVICPSPVLQYYCQMLHDSSALSLREKQLELNQSAIHKNKHTHFSPQPLLPLRQTTPIQRNTHTHSQYLLPPTPKVTPHGITTLPQEKSHHRIEDSPQPLSKSRKLDLDTSPSSPPRYQFGFDGVKVCQEVIEKYKASNYTIQKNVLERFQKEAQLFRRNRNQRQPRPTTPHALPPRITPRQEQYQPNGGLLWHQEEERRRAQEERLRMIEKERERERRLQQQQQEKRRAQRRLRRQQRDQHFLRRQKENMIRVGNMLREIDHKLKENSSKLAADLNNLRQQLKPSKGKFHNVNEQHFIKIANRISENTQSCNKIPVVMYNSQICQPRLHYEESTGMIPSIQRGEMGNDAEHMQGVLRLLRRNEERLKMLTECSEGSAYE